MPPLVPPLVPPFTVSDALALCSRRLLRAGFDSAAAEAATLLEAATGLTRTEQLMRGERALNDDERATLVAMLHRRLLHEPLQHVTGSAPFYGLNLVVTPAVLVPRPETERLVELVLVELAAGAASRQPAATAGSAVTESPLATTVLDVGTGSGAIALALKAERPDLAVWGSDVSAEALSVAIENARQLALDVKFRRSDLLADPEIAAVAAQAGAIVANLPYLPDDDEPSLPPEVRRDPPSALFGGPAGLDLAERLRLQAQRLMLPGALLALELDERNAATFARRLVGWREVSVEPDLAGRRRFVLARR